MIMCEICGGIVRSQGRRGWWLYDMIARRCFWFFRCRFIISNFSFCIAC